MDLVDPERFNLQPVSHFELRRRIYNSLTLVGDYMDLYHGDLADRIALDMYKVARPAIKSKN